MGDLIDDSVLDKFAVRGTPQELATQIHARYGDLIDRTAAAYTDMDEDDKLAFLNAMRAA